MRSASEVEQNIVSVERMLQYIELKPEAPYEIPETHPEGVWPAEGRIEFKCPSSKTSAPMRLLTAPVWQEILVEISSRPGFSAQGYFGDTGIVFGTWAQELY